MAVYCSCNHKYNRCKKLEINNSFGIPKVIWMVFLVFIASMVTAVILDILIISASGLKEVSLGWAKISKDEVQANIEEQKIIWIKY